MLDVFLEVVHGRTKQAEAEDRTRALLSRLPAAELRKIASMGQAVPMATKAGSGDGCWLDKFRGSPLLDQAIGLEKEELEIQMAENTRRAAQREVTQQYGDWDTDQAKRDEISIKRRLLELELAGADMNDVGGQEGEDVIPPGAGEPPPDTAVDTSGAAAGAVPQPTVENAPPSPDTPEDKPSAGPPDGDGPPASLSQGEEKPKAEKPKTTKITTVEKPTEDKERVDIKAASARMRFSIAASSFLGGEKRANAAALGSAALAGGLGTAGYFRGKHMARQDEKPSIPLNVAGSILFPPMLPYAVGKVIGHGVQSDRMADAKEKQGSFLDGKAEGLGRVGQLLTGSRKKLLEEASGHAKTMFGANGQQLADTLAGDAVREGRKVLATRVGAGAAGAGAVGLGTKAILDRKKEAQIKEAFGAAMLQGLKGMGQFAVGAGKMVAGATRAGGVKAGLGAAGQAGRLGMQQAGNFLQHNPMAGAALVAAPAAAVGYAAGRQ